LTSVKAIKNDPARPKWQQLALNFNFRGGQAFGHSGCERHMNSQQPRFNFNSAEQAPPAPRRALG